MNDDNINELINTVTANRKKFQNYNNMRLQWFYESLSKKNIIDLLGSIPFFITSNFPDLPGFIENFDPPGMEGYYPTGNSLSFISKRFPSVQVKSYKNQNPLIELFAIIGSAGSIAYNEDSDIDFWVCIDENRVTPEIITNLKSKLRSIELWITETFNMETHFFLNDTSKVRQDIFDTDEHDISGKAIGKLLKDEFYRTSILLNGKIPYWWVLPEVNDETYENYIQALNDSKQDIHFIDLGNLYSIQKENFLGAGLFQILKSLGNPFKSILKIGILERYLLDESSQSPFLCNILKKSVHTGILTTDTSDPYILMFNNVLEYHTRKTGESSAMSTEILKMCFYIKIDPKLSTYMSLQEEHSVKINTGRSGDVSLQRDINVSEKISKMIEFTNQWKWSSRKLDQIDNFQNWDITTINNLWNNITKEILKSYKRILANIESQKDAVKLSDKEMKLISRMIYSSLSSSDNKIKMGISFKDNPIEKQLAIESISEKDGKISWLLSKGFSGKNVSSKKVIIHKEASLIGILIWISMCRMFQKDYTRIDIKSRYQILDSSYARDLLTELTLYFSAKNLNIRNKYFLEDSFPIHNFIIINPYSKHPKGVEDIYFLYHNSWEETVFENYTSEIDLAHIITKLLNGALKHREKFEDCTYITSPYPYKASHPFRIIESLFKDIYDFFIVSETEGFIERRYIAILGNNYVVFSSKKIKGLDSIVCTIYKSELVMLYSLSNVIGIKTSIRIFSHNTELEYIRTIIDNQKENVIQIYFQKARKYCYFFVSDERGSLIFFRKTTDNFIDYLNRIYIFAHNVIARIILTNKHSVLNHKERNIEVYEIERDDTNRTSIKDITSNLKKTVFEYEKGTVSLKLSINLMENGEMGYRFTLPDGSNSETYTKSSIGEIAREMAVLMESVNGYNYNVTDVNLANLDLRIYKNFTSFSFSEKNRFELLMEKFIRN